MEGSAREHRLDRPTDAVSSSDGNDETDRRTATDASLGRRRRRRCSKASVGRHDRWLLLERERTVVRSLGVDHVIDHTVGDALGDPGQYDLIVQLAGRQSATELRPLLEKRGTLVLSSGEGGRWFGPLGRLAAAIAVSPFVTQRFRTFVATSTPANLARLTELIESEQVAPAVDRVFPLSQMTAALRHFQQPHGRGKTIITMEHPD